MNKVKISELSFLDQISVVLVKPMNQGNIGAVARSMANFDFSKLAIVGDIVIEKEARNRAKHANHIIKNVKYFKTFEEARNAFDLVIGTSGIVGNDENLLRSPLTIEETINKIKNHKGRIGLFFGPEDKGLTKDQLLLCDFLINISCSEKYGIMNLSHASTIILYEFFKAFKKKEFREDHALASIKEKDVTYEIILGILENMRFKAESDRVTQKKLWRKVLGKSFITKREISSIMGFFRNVDYSMKKRKSEKSSESAHSRPK